jgi:hypothetical protein
MLVIPGLRQYLDQYALPGPDGLVFVGPNGPLLRRSNFRRRIFLPVLARAGLPEIHFHDLRYAGNALICGCRKRCHLGRFAGERLRSGLRQVVDALVCTWLCVR